MSNKTAQAFINAMNNKDVETAASLLTDDAKIHSPIGVKEGREKAKGMLKVIKNMSIGKMSDPKEDEDGTLCSSGRTLMGKAIIWFHFEGDKISEIKAK